MRTPLFAPLASRDGGLTRDALTVNGLVELRGKQVATLRRPGLLEAFDLVAGQAQGAVYWKGTLFAARGDELIQGPSVLPVADGSLWDSTTDIGIASHTSSATSIRSAVLGVTVYLIINLNPRLFYKSTDGVNFVVWSPSGFPTNAEMSNNGTLNFFEHNGFLFVHSAGNSVLTGLWRSSDGETWTQATAATGWANVYDGVGFLSAGTTLYALGPNNSTTVWRSTNNGAAFTQIAATGVQGPCWGTAFFNNKLWWFGGSEVKSSSDGVTWAQETAAPGWAYSGGKSYGLVYNNRLWNFIPQSSGGAGTGYVEVCNSLDGVTWTKVHSGLAFSSYYNNGYQQSMFAGAHLFGNTVWAFGNRYISSSSEQPKSMEAVLTAAGGDAYSLGTGELRLDFTSTGAAAATDYLFLKTTESAWVLTFGSPGTLTEVTDADFPENTVPGVVSLDGYIFVMTIDGIIYNSDLEAPLAWNALNFITAESEPDQGVAIAKHQSYVVALKARTIELFYDAGNATGSPLLPMSNAVHNIGCANGYTIAYSDGGLFFLSRTNSQNISLHYFAPDSLTPVELADEALQRVLSSADLTDAKAWAGKVAGHTLYVLALPEEGLTLYYDLTSKVAGQFTLLTAQTAASVTSITQADGLVTVHWPSHGCADGDPVTFAGAGQAAYNGLVNVNYVDADHLSFYVDASTVSPATGTITAVRYTAGYFPFTALVAFDGKNYLQHELNGKLYEFSLDHLTDAGVPIDLTLRLPRVDAKTTLLKKVASLDIIGTKEDVELLVRWSDDDMQTVSKYRRVNLANELAQLRRCGNTYQRVLEFKYTDEALIRLNSVEIL